MTNDYMFAMLNEEDKRKAQEEYEAMKWASEYEAWLEEVNKSNDFTKPIDNKGKKD